MSLLLNATDLELPGRISRVQFIDLHGDVLMEIPTQLYETRPALYNVSNILTPTQFFYIKVTPSFHRRQRVYAQTLCLHLDNSTTTWPNFTKYFVHVDCGHGLDLV